MSAHFCTQCGTRLESSDRFCVSCGTAVASNNPSQASQTERQKPPIPWPILFGVIGSLLLVATVGISLYRANSREIVDVADEHDAAGIPYSQVPRISVAEVKDRLENRAPIVIDVRSANEYSEAHIANAISMPLDQLQTRYQELAPNAEIVIYCT